MKRIMQKLKPYKHGSIPILYGIVYLICFFYLENRPVESFHVIHAEIDDMIPFCEVFIIPYYLWFAYIALSVAAFVFFDKGKKDFWKLCIALGFGMTFFLIFSYIYPNELHLRPDSFTRDNIFVTLVRGIYASDTATNVFPSIHCYNSMVVNVAICHNQQFRKYKSITICSNILSILIILSTVFVKQHSVIDVIGAFVMFLPFYLVLYLYPALKEKRALSAAGIAEGTLS